jgi:hypothetical protein
MMAQAQNQQKNRQKEKTWAKDNPLTPAAATAAVIDAITDRGAEPRNVPYLPIDQLEVVNSSLFFDSFYFFFFIFLSNGISATWDSSKRHQAAQRGWILHG